MDFSTFRNVVWKEGEHYVAQSLNVDVSSFGETKKDAIKALREALVLYFEDGNAESFSEISDPEIVVV